MKFTGKWLIQTRKGATIQDADTRAEARMFAAAEVGVPYRIVRNPAYK